ncbi:MAG: cation:proton antiporter [Candidatus Promineifilaceae bacterium]|nr:cation:proton antiporter [Candidatus Promineifilaceae bacterium]
MNLLQAAALYVAMPIMGLGLLLAFARAMRGPRLPDRVVALDLLVMLGIGIMAAYAIAFEQESLLDIITVVALINFLATVSFAYYLEQRGMSQ